MIYQNFRFAYTYNSGAYGAGDYATGESTTTGSASSTSGGGSLLTNTGFDIAVTITIAAVILLAAVLVRYWKRPKKANANV